MLCLICWGNGVESNDNVHGNNKVVHELHTTISYCGSSIFDMNVSLVHIYTVNTLTRFKKSNRTIYAAYKFAL